MKLITRSKIVYTLKRQEEIKKLISQLEANGKKKEAKEQAYFLLGLQIALDDLTGLQTYAKN